MKKFNVKVISTNPFKLKLVILERSSTLKELECELAIALMKRNHVLFPTRPLNHTYSWNLQGQDLNKK